MAMASAEVSGRALSGSGPAVMVIDPLDEVEASSLNFTSWSPPDRPVTL